MQIFKIKRKKIDKNVYNLTSLILLMFVQKILSLYQQFFAIKNQLLTNLLRINNLIIYLLIRTNRMLKV